MIAQIILFFHFETSGISLEVQKNSGIFRGRSATHLGSGGALRAWKIFDFELPRYFNVAILATKTAL